MQAANILYRARTAGKISEACMYAAEFTGLALSKLYQMAFCCEGIHTFVGTTLLWCDGSFQNSPVSLVARCMETFLRESLLISNGPKCKAPAGGMALLCGISVFGLFGALNY
jgi:hypothetical protein